MSDDDVPIRLILERIERKVDDLAGIPGSVRTLQDHYLDLTAALVDLKATLTHHGEQLAAHRIQLRDTEPALAKLDDLTGKVDVLIPRVERAIERLDAVQEQATNAAEHRAKLQRSVEELEHDYAERERATGNGQ